MSGKETPQKKGNDEPICKYCHYFVPSMSDVFTGYCLVHKKEDKEEPAEIRRFSESCCFFEERKGKGFLADLGLEDPEDEKKIML